MTSAQDERGGARVRFPPPLVFVGLLVAGAVVQQWIRPLALPLPFWPRVVAGVVTALAGALLLLAANAWFKRTGQHPAPWKPSPELIAQGIYRHTRNPMYVGMTLVLLGLGVALGNPWIIALAPIALLIVHVIAVLPEEAYLTEKFGESYTRYRSTVRRYF